MTWIGPRPSVLILAATLLLAACGDDSSGGDAAYDFTVFEEEILAFIAEVDEVEGVGAILVHRDDGVIFQRSFGTFTDDRIYLVSSSSKMISAGVLMRLADQGLLDMDEPIVDAVAWGDHNPAITPAQLVSNSSGLVGLTDDPIYGPNNVVSVSSYCIAATSNSAINNTAGLGGPGRLRQPGRNETNGYTSIP